MWSYLLAVVGILGLYIAGKKKASGWAIGLSAQVLWVVYAVSTKQWGFIVSAIAYGTMYAKNWLSWKRAEQQEPNNG